MINWHVIVSGLVIAVSYAAGCAIVDYLNGRRGRRALDRINWERP